MKKKIMLLAVLLTLALSPLAFGEPGIPGMIAGGSTAASYSQPLLVAFNGQPGIYKIGIWHDTPVKKYLYEYCEDHRLRLLGEIPDLTELTVYRACSYIIIAYPVYGTSVVTILVTK